MAAGLGVLPLSRARLTGGGPPGLAIGYGASPADQLRAGIAAVAAMIN
jgi:hypothetical protein